MREATDHPRHAGESSSHGRAVRTLGSLTAGDIGRSIQDPHDRFRGAVKTVRHFSIESGPAAGRYTAVIVKVPTDNPREADHREICAISSTAVEVS